jgi:hypothetical protein
MNATRIATRCAGCNEPLQIKMPMVGKHVRCSACGISFVAADVFFSGQLSGHRALLDETSQASAPTVAAEPAEPQTSAAGLAALLEVGAGTAAPVRQPARKSGRRKRWPRMLAMNLAISGVTALGVWLVSTTLTNYAIVRWNVDDALLENRFQFFVDDQPVELQKTVTEQRLKPGRHTLTVLDEGNQLQRSEFSLTAKEILTYHVHTEKITIEGGGR